MKFKNFSHFGGDAKSLSERLQIKPGKKSVFKARKQEVINDFNNAVTKGASEQFLKSLYAQAKWELSECNSHLGLLPQDGLALLNYSPITFEQLQQSAKIVEDSARILSVNKAIEEMHETLPPIPRNVEQVIAVPKDFKSKGE